MITACIFAGGEEHLAKHINEDSLTADQLCKLLWALALFDNGSWKRWQRFISALASRPLQVQALHMQACMLQNAMFS